MALGSVAARVVEGIFVLIGSLSLLALLTVSQESLAAGSAAPSSFPATGEALLAVAIGRMGLSGCSRSASAL